jgi:hypothetical protein
VTHLHLMTQLRVHGTCDVLMCTDNFTFTLIPFSIFLVIFMGANHGQI